MKDNKNKKNTGAGFYLALCCCVAAMGIVGFVNSQKEKESEPFPITDVKKPELPVITLAPEPLEEAVEAKAPKIVEEEDTKAKVKSEDADVIETGENVEFYEGDVLEAISPAELPKFKMPAKGEVCTGFSGDTLYYDSVMGDFRTHDGIDILAPADTNVVAAADGVIEDVYVDTIGKAVIINHNNGYKTKYANLDDIENLKVGMELKEGDFIAHVGTYSFGENTTEPHLHFEILLDGKCVNPEEYIK